MEIKRTEHTLRKLFAVSNGGGILALNISTASMQMLWTRCFPLEKFEYTSAGE